MPRYRYRAMTCEGAAVRGELEAPSLERALERLKLEGLIPLEARPLDAGMRFRPRLSGRSIAPSRLGELARALALLLRAGERLEGALLVVARDSRGGGLRHLLLRVRERLRSGASPAQAFASEEGRFEPRFLALIAAGERTGQLAEAFERLAELYERECRFREQLRGALVYPALLAAATLASILLVLLWVVPEFARLLADRSAALPALTRLIFTLSESLRSDPALLLGPGLGLLAILLGLRLPALRRALEGHALSVPLLGPALRERSSAEFARALALLLAGGLELPRAVGLAAQAVKSAHARSALGRVPAGIDAGRSFGDCLEEAGVLAPLALRLFRVGEESGRIAETAAFLAERLENRITERATRLARLVEPLLILFLGAIVGTIVAAVMGALASLGALSR